MMHSRHGRGQVEVHQLSENDLPSLVDIHARAFPAAAMTRLGRETLRRYFDWQFNGPHELHAIGATVDGTLVGFCLGGTFKGAVGGFVHRHRWYLAGRVLMRPHLLAASPEFRARLRIGLRILKAPVRHRTEGPRTFRLLVIAVDPAWQNLGVGTALMRSTEETAITKAFTWMHLGVQPANRRAIGFYERLGWITEPSGAGWTVSMRKNLDREQSALEQ